ncbi:AB hydrolase superfamily protein [Abortiporus biennis]
MTSKAETKYYHHGRFNFSGGVLPDAITAYRTYGDPKNPCIVFPTCYGGRLDSQDYMIGPDKALDPTKYYVVTLALFANGESSSPSNTPSPYNGPYFPAVTYEDNIRAQYAVLTKELNVAKVFCVIGFSMGGQQAYYWPIMYPDYVEKFIALCGSARTSPHNQCFLEGPKTALVSSKDFNDGHYTSTPYYGIRAFARVYSAWAYGQTWYREKQYLYNGKFSTLDNFIHDEWEKEFVDTWDANDMLSLLITWQLGDVSRLDYASTADLSLKATVKSLSPSAITPDTEGDLESVLGKIKAKGLIMPCKTDLYFPPEDSENEVAAMTKAGVDAKLVIIPSVWGHLAGGGSNDADDKFIKDEVNKFLET